MEWAAFLLGLVGVPLALVGIAAFLLHYIVGTPRDTFTIGCIAAAGAFGMRASDVLVARVKERHAVIHDKS